MILNRPSIQYKEGIISVEMAFPDANRFTQYAFYLYNSKREAVKKVMYTGSNRCQFDAAEIAENTKCFIKVFVKFKNHENEKYKKESVNSKMILIYSSDLEKEFLSYIADEVPKADYILPYWHMQYPYQDILLVYNMSKQHLAESCISAIAKEYDLYMTGDDEIAILASQHLNEVGGGNNCIFRYYP